MKTIGLVLSKTSHDNYDAILRIFTLDFGLQKFFGRSFDRPRGKLKSIFYPFYKVEMTFAPRENINLLKTGCLLEEYTVKSFFQGINFFYISKLIEKIQPENVADERVFKLLDKTYNLLTRLKDKKSIFNAVASFEKKIFGFAGFYDANKDAYRPFSQKEIREVLEDSEILKLRSLILHNVS